MSNKHQFRDSLNALKLINHKDFFSFPDHIRFMIVESANRLNKTRTKLIK